MTPLFPAHRAAEEFDSVLEGRATTAVAERYAALGATVQVLRDQPEVLPRAEFVADLRERLMLAAATDMVPAAPVVRRLPSKSRRNRRLGTVAASLVIVGGSAGMAAAASGSLPGEALYPIKRGVEQVQIASHFSDASKGTALLGQASTRLDELQKLVSSGSADQSVVDDTVADFRGSANSGADKLFKAYQADGDAADVTAVRDFTKSAMAQLDAMSSDADPSTTGSLRDTADTLADIDQQASTLCVACGGAALAPPDGLAAGSGAASVSNLIARPVKQARQDIATQTAITAAQVGKLKDLAQGQADKLKSSSSASGGGAGALTAPLTGTLTSTGKVVPSLVDDTASTATNLVTGLTGTVASVTGGGGGGSSGDPVGDTVKKAGDDVGKTVGGLTGQLGGSLDGLTKDLAPQN